MAFRVAFFASCVSVYALLGMGRAQAAGTVALGIALYGLAILRKQSARRRHQ